MVSGLPSEHGERSAACSSTQAPSTQLPPSGQTAPSQASRQVPASQNEPWAQVTAAQAAFDGVREEATLGARTTLDVLDAEQELLDARATKLQSEAARYVGTYALLSAMGLLTADHLQLGIPTYDPEAYYDAVKNAPATSSRGKKLDKILEKIGN